MLKSTATLRAERPLSVEESAFDDIRLDELRGRVAPIADIVENKGGVCLEDVVSRAWLSRANSEIESHYSMHDTLEAVVENVGARPDCFAHAAVGNGQLQAFLTALAWPGARSSRRTNLRSKAFCDWSEALCRRTNRCAFTMNAAS